ncbi:hypothetical protein DFH07DRAFT_944176 [Mycena maculata]|uniref:VIT domain-containing protein n=1 Tax=Mycena maculata TaxID=230809 RepID=A0AAD7IAV2_9AGAR|nr:hypothetical protein DFH07DRAFT_944176 [Mycena maculata]
MGTAVANTIDRLAENTRSDIWTWFVLIRVVGDFFTENLSGGDGTKVVGRMQEKEEARETYQSAVADGKQAAWMDQQTPDVFSLAVGNIQPREQVCIELTVLTEDEENDSVGFHLPVHVGTRYGVPWALPNAQELPFSNYAPVSLASDTELDRDFVLAVNPKGARKQRKFFKKKQIRWIGCPAMCRRAPSHPSYSRARLYTGPSLQNSDLARQEFVFLVDRSGRPYNQTTVDAATKHVDEMEANYGGTQIRAALQQCFGMRQTDRPTTIFLLTDGEAWDLEGVLNEVKERWRTRLHKLTCESRSSASETLPPQPCARALRVSTTFTGKIARLLKAACMPRRLSDIRVGWGVPVVEAHRPSDVVAEDAVDAFVMVPDDEGTGHRKGKGRATLDVFDEAVDPLRLDYEPVPPPSQVEQSPFNIRTLSPGNRLNVYAILQGKTISKAITLAGLTEDGSEIRLSVPVTFSPLPNAPESPPVIHTLAARKIIQDLEDGQHGLGSSIQLREDADLLVRTVQASIVRLGKIYIISSSQTSFVAPFTPAPAHQKSFVGGDDLNMKKSWHPLLLKNQERMWIEEKKAACIATTAKPTERVFDLVPDYNEHDAAPLSKLGRELGTSANQAQRLSITPTRNIGGPTRSKRSHARRTAHFSGSPTRERPTAQVLDAPSAPAPGDPPTAPDPDSDSSMSCP